MAEEKVPSKEKLVDAGQQPVPKGVKNDVDYGPGYKPAGDSLPNPTGEYKPGKQSGSRGLHANQKISKTSSSNEPGWRGK